MNTEKVCPYNHAFQKQNGITCPNGCIEINKYGITYYDRLRGATIDYLNRTSFDTEELALEEIERCKKHDEHVRVYLGYESPVRNDYQIKIYSVFKRP